MKTTYTKVIRELRLYKGRTLLALIGILIGVFSIGFVLSSYAILLREMDKNYMDTNPASIVLTVNGLDQEGLSLLQKAYPQTEIEAREMVQGRIYRDNGTYGTIYLYAVQDFNNISVDTFTLEQGAFPDDKSQMVLERDSLKNLPNLTSENGHAVTVKLPNGTDTSVTLSGFVHAPGLPPASMEKFSYGFMTLEGLKQLGYEGWYDEVHIISPDYRYDRETLQNLTIEMKAFLSGHGYETLETKVPAPGKHPHGDQLQSLLFMLQAFTIIALFVACIIIVNLFNAIMSTQVKQIAVIKATGAGTWDIAMPYIMYVLTISICAVVLSVPLSQTAGRLYSDMAANILNFKITSYQNPLWIYGVLSLSGILIPLFAAFGPIYKSCRISVKDGLAEQTGMRPSAGNRLITRMFMKARTMIKIPVGNVLRKRGRTLLGVLALAASGLIFMTAQNIVASIDQTVGDTMNTFGYNYDIRLAANYDTESIDRALETLDSVDGTEIYLYDKGKLTGENSLETLRYTIKAIPHDSTLFKLFSFEDAAKNGIIINQGLRDEETWLKENETVALNIGSRQAGVTITGIIDEVPPIPTIYMDMEFFIQTFPDAGLQGFMLSAFRSSNVDLSNISADIEKALFTQNVNIAENWNITLLRNSFVDHLKVIVSFLSVVAILAVIVGGLSIASVIGMNVSERRREIGVLRAIGADAYQTVTIFSAESMLIGIAGWLFGFLCSVPVSVWASNYFGQIFLHSNLNNTISVKGLLLWLALSVLASCVSGLIPAGKAATAPLRDMLAYE